MTRKLIMVGILLMTVLLTLVACAPAPAPLPTATPPPSPSASPPPAKPASFTTANLIINPAEVTSGSKVTIQVTVTNLGELAGSYDVNLKIDDTVEATENITLAGGASQNVTFAISKSIAKTYAVNVSELSGTFVVKSIPLPPPVVSPPPAPAPPTFSGWGPVLWGPEFQATPGISSTTSKVKESKLQDGSAAIWYLLNTVPVFPQDDQVYYLWFKDAFSADPPRQMPGTVKAGPFGLLGDLVGDVRYSLMVGVGSFRKGEAFEFAVANNDKTIVVFWKIIPAPIEVRQGRYRLWVERKSSDGKVFLAWGEGFGPNEEIDVASTSEGEVLSSKSKADADGRVMVALLPSVVGKANGSASITLKGKAGEIKVSYDWGPLAVVTQ